MLQDVVCVQEPPIGVNILVVSRKHVASQHEPLTEGTRCMVCLHTSYYVYLHVYTHIFYIYICICIHIYIHNMCIHVYVHTRTAKERQTCAKTCKHACIYTCIYMNVCIQPYPLGTCFNVLVLTDILRTFYAPSSRLAR